MNRLSNEETKQILWGVIARFHEQLEASTDVEADLRVFHERRLRAQPSQDRQTL